MKTLGPTDMKFSKLRLKKHLVMRMSKDNIFTIPLFNPWCESETVDKAVMELSEQLESLWEVYVEDISVGLTKDAMKLRDKLKEYLEVREDGTRKV